MQRKLTVLFLILFCSQYYLKAQDYTGHDADALLKGAEMLRMKPENKQFQYVRLGTGVNISEEQSIDYVKRVYQLSGYYQFKQLSKETDALGYTHIRMQLSYETHVILGSMLILHFKDNRLHSFNGEVFKVETETKKAQLSEAQCLKIALDSIHAESYLWEHADEEEAIREIKQDPKATWFPKGELAYAPEDLNFSKPFHLVYKFNIHASVPRTAENIYIDAVSGILVARENQLHTTDVPGKAQTKYSGLQKIITDSTAPFNYRLRENTRGNGIYTFNMKKGTNYGLATDFLDSNNVWNNINANEDEIATDAHWGAETTYDYYKNKFNRNSYNNNNARINSFVHYSNNYDNAFWDGVRMTYGDGNTFKPLTSIDVCGHEITHAVTSSTANLIYSYESGQLNESFSDIFGNSVERYGRPNLHSWIIGEDITNNGSGLRNMSDPRIKGHPRCYKGTNWYFGAADNGGVHLNSGVQNWWYYLITEGGSGTNDFSDVYKVDSLGILTAEQIAYRNLTVYLTPTSQYADSRFYSIQAAIDLYGQCSKEVIAVTNAWYACHVGPAYDSGFVKADFSADTVVCSSSKTVQFKNLSSNVSSNTWYFGDGTTSGSYNPNHVYGAYGNFTIKLVVNSCFKNLKDSMVKTAYIKIDSTFDICNAVFMPLTGTDSTHKCASFVYDDGAEDDYKQLRTTYLRISTPGADSIRINFLDFDYELNYDSLYIYKGKYPGGVKIGGYTGSTLPNAGKFIVVPGAMVTLRHVSDPYVVGRGFKLYYQSFKKAVQVTAFSDTSICYGNSTLLHAQGKGGYVDDYRFQWKGISNDDSIIVSPLSTTSYQVYLNDVCSGTKDSATVKVTVRNPLKLTLSRDTTLCAGAKTDLGAFASGGLSSAYRFDWDNGLGTGNTKNISPIAHTTYRVILSDGCTPKNDTAFVSIRVKDALKVKAFSNDTIVCYGKQGTLNAQGSGGDTMNYFYFWNNGLGFTPQVFFNFLKSTMVKVNLTDACSGKAAEDSIFILVRAPLTMGINEDTLICKGTSTKLTVNASGGDASKYSYQWIPALADTSIHTVKPATKTMYYVTLLDNCSNPIKDSVLVDVMSAINVTGLRDTTICSGMDLPLVPVVTGGRSSTYTYKWNPGLNPTPTQLVKPNGSAVYRVIVNDGCTVFGDTATASVTVKIPLSAKITSNDTVICYNKTSSLTASGNGGVSSQYSFDWDNGLGNGSSKSIALTQSTWLKVTLTDACTVLPSVDSIFIKVRPEMKVDLPKDSLICYGSDFNLNAITVGGDLSKYSYTWTQGLPALANHVVKPIASTKYKVTLNDGCSDDASDSVLVTVLPALKINGIKDTVICYGGSTNFLPQINGGVPANYSFTWDNGLSAQKNQTVSPISNTTYTLKVDDACSKPADSVSVTVTVRPALVVNAKLIPNSICEGDSAKLIITRQGGLAASHTWDVNGSSTLMDTLLVKPSTSTNYLVNLDDNCSSPASDLVNLNVNPKPFVDFSISKTDVCRLERVLFNNLSTGAVSYVWQVNPLDSVLRGKSPTYIYTSPGSYDISLTAKSDSGCIEKLTKLAFINVIELPTSNFSYLPQVPDFLNRAIGFTNLSKDFTGFDWDFGDFTTDNTNEHPQHKYGDTGTYPVRLITTNSIGCKDTMLQLLRVKDVFRVFFPNAISMNNDNVNDSFIILGRGIQWYNLQIFNRWGEMIYNGDMGDAPFKGLDQKGEPLIKGSYLINLTVRDFEGFLYFKREMLEIL